MAEEETTIALAELAYERSYFERGFIAAAAWLMTNTAFARLNDAVIDHAWAHRDEGVDEEDALPLPPASTPAASADVAILSALEAERAKPIQGPEHGAWDRGRRYGLDEAIKIARAAGGHAEADR